MSDRTKHHGGGTANGSVAGGENNEQPVLSTRQGHPVYDNRNVRASGY
ncbi:MAG TPA: hypothetical protein VK689_00825 [Armatimonadota bacterium]|nr:hypothetical protein [Armatimonadota bacterium]